MSKFIETDSMGRVNLGKKYAKTNFLLDEDEEGALTLQKAVVIPERELWIHKNSKAMRSVLRGLEEAKQGLGKTNAIDLDAYEDD